MLNHGPVTTSELMARPEEGRLEAAGISSSLNYCHPLSRGQSPAVLNYHSSINYSGATDTYSWGFSFIDEASCLSG